MEPLKYLTPAEIDAHLYECRVLRWIVVAALTAFWFLAICFVLTYA